MAEVAAANDAGGVAGEREDGLVGVEGKCGVLGAVCRVAGGAIVACEAGGGGEDDEVAEGEGGGLRGGAQAEDTSGA